MLVSIRVIPNHTVPSSTPRPLTGRHIPTCILLTASLTYQAPLKLPSELLGPSAGPGDLRGAGTGTHLASRRSTAGSDCSYSTAFSFGATSPRETQLLPPAGPGCPAEAQQVNGLVLSLKLMVSAGSVYDFHVGGGVDEEGDPEVPSWTFFVGDRQVHPAGVMALLRRDCAHEWGSKGIASPRPHHLQASFTHPSPLIICRPLSASGNDKGARGCFAQLAAIEQYS